MDNTEKYQIVFEVAKNEVNTALRGMAASAQTASAAGAQVGKAAAGASGPFQRLINLQRQYQQAIKAGNYASAGDASMGIRRTQAQIEKYGQTLQPAAHKGVMSQAWGVLKSSRFGVGGRGGGGGLMPLVGKTMEALGPAGQIAAAVIAVATAFYDLTKAAAAVTTQFTAMSYATGGTVNQNAALLGIGNVLGMSPEAIGSAASAFNGLITSDPYARAAAGQMGISNAPGPYGSQNYAKELLAAIKGLRAISDPTEQMRQARMLHLTEFLPYTKLSDRTLDRMGAQGAQTSQLMTPAYQQKVVEFNAATGMLGQAMDNLGVAITSPWIGKVTAFIQGLTDIITNMGSPHDSLIAGMGDNRKALDRNTDSHDKNTDQLGAMQRQYGHGARLDGAIPAASGMGSGYALRQNIRGNAFRLGAAI